METAQVRVAGHVCRLSTCRHGVNHKPILALTVMQPVEEAGEAQTRVETAVHVPGFN